MNKKTWLPVILVLVVVFGGIFGGKIYVSHRAAVAAAHRGIPPVTVSTATAADQPWSPYAHAVGSLEAVSGTEITAQIAGNVTQIAFRSGQRVYKGELLVQLDNSTQLAQLHADQAKLQLADTTLVRTRKLYVAHAASQSDLQTAQADFSGAQAVVEGDRATLAKLAISAPFSGTVGIREVSLGQYVSPGTSVVNLQTYDPMLLDFSLPQSAVSEIAAGKSVQFTVDAYPGKKFNGRITAIGSEVDPATRNIALQARLDNAGGQLRPGMYGDVQISIGRERHGVVVPNTAISYNTFGDYIYVVTPLEGNGKHELVVHQRVVQVSDERGSEALLAGGVQAGETVVTAGQSSLRDGAVVVVNNSVQP
ncbi:MAG: efflux RND transporter periplasmic adaptor subunit [Gammaproteobacteria bacterium]